MNSYRYLVEKVNEMDIQAEKIRLIEWLAGLNDTKTLNEFISLKKKVDWWDEISSAERAEIEEGLAQADNGEVVPHQEVMGKYKKWL